MLAGQAKITLYGQDGGAVLAFEALVKVCGWAGGTHGSRMRQEARQRPPRP